MQAKRAASRRRAEAAARRRSRRCGSDRKPSGGRGPAAQPPVRLGVSARGLAPLLVLGLDGATFEVIRPLAAAGRLPELAAWLREGAAAPLASSVPPTSFPAWSSFLTGSDPGEHGIFDFTQKLPNAYRLRFVNASDRRGASLFARVGAAGGRVLALGVPATHPPEPVRGLLVPGFDAPISAGSEAQATSDPALYRALAARCGPWMVRDLEEGAGAANWHERAAARLAERVERKTAFALEALAELRRRGEAPDLCCVVFAESDTVQHHFWRDFDPASPRHDPRASAARRAAVPAVYERLDAACGALRRAFGPEASCVVLSDHGAGGASRRVVRLNARLREAGLLRRARRRQAPSRDLLARAARDVLLQKLPPRLAERLFRRARAAAARWESVARFGGFDWARSTAFSEEANTQPGVWINLRGREAEGCVAASDYERVRDEVIGALLDWKLPDGSPVVRCALRREEIHAGPLIERAPDVVVELGLDGGYGLSLVATPWREEAPEALRTLDDTELAGGRGRGLNGTHRPEGIWIGVGPAAALAPPARLAQVAPALLQAMGVGPAPSPEPPLPAPSAYTPEQEARVAARLRALGYLE